MFMPLGPQRFQVKKINNLYNIASVKSWKLYSVATEIENATTISMVCWEIKGLPFSIGGI